VTEKLLVDIAGWAAALLILGGYALLTAGKVDAKSPLYQSMNVLGAIGFIINSGYFKARAGLGRGHDDEPAVDLLPPVHPRGIFLPDVAALCEADAVQLGGVAFEPEEIAELGAAFAHAEGEAMRQPAEGGFFGRRQPAATECGKAGVGGTLLAIRGPMDRQRFVALDRDRAAEAIHAQALRQLVDGLGLAVDQQVVAVAPDEEIE
jgi:hypothetical protein